MANTVQIILEVDDKGSAKIKQFSSALTDQVKKTSEAAVQSAGAVGQVETAYQKLQAGVASVFTKLQAHWVAFSAAAVAVGLAVSKALEYISKGGAALKAEESFRAMSDSAKVNADLLLASMKKAVDGFVDDSHLMQKASFVMAQDIDPNKIPALFEAARLASRKTGADVTSSIDGMIQGISTNMPRSLRQMGAITKEQMTVLNHAMAAGVTSISLVDIVLANAAVDAAKFGTASNNAAKDIDRLKVAAEELREAVGKAEINILGGLMGVLKGVAALALEGAGGIFKLIEATERLAAYGAEKVGMSGVAKTLRDGADRWKAEADAARGAAAKLAQEGHDAIFGIETKADLRTDAQKKREIFEAEYTRKFIEDLQKIQIAEEASQKKRLAQDMEYLKKWEGQNDAIGRTSLEKELAILDREYEGVKRVNKGKLDIERLYNEQKANLTRTSALKVAEEDKKALGARLADAQKFYGSVLQLIQKNAEEEKKHVEELNALYRQQADIRKSTEAQIRGLREIGMTPGQKYESQKSAISDQYMAAMKLSGQEQIKALEEYKQALASFGQTWSDGVSETSKNMLIGDKTSVIVAGKDIIKSVISDIEAAAAMQQRALESLTAEKEKQIQTDRAWGEVLKQTAEQAATDIRYLQGVVGDLEAQITAMQKTITLTGDDQVSWVVDNIARALNSLHDKTVYITTVYRNAYGSDGGASAGGSGAGLNLSELDLNAPPSPTPFALGTGYVPKTGLYMLHRGEAVTPPAQAARQSSTRIGDIVINIPDSAAPQRPEDWRLITRQYIVPELEKIGHA